MNELLCPFCEQGELRPHSHSTEVTVEDKTLRVEGLESHYCEHCSETVIFPAQARANQKRIADAKRKVQGLLSGDEIRAAREHLGLTQEAAAQIFGGGRNAFSKYERGDVIQSVAMDRVIRLAMGSVDSLRRLCDWADVPVPDVFSYSDVDQKVVGCDFTKRMSRRAVQDRYLHVGSNVYHDERLDQ